MKHSPRPDGSVRFGRFELLPLARELRCDGVQLRIGSRVFDLLEALARAHPDAVTADALVQSVWGKAPVGRNNLRVQMTALRKLIGSEWIRHDPVHGYRLVGPVQTLVSEEAADDEAASGNLQAQALPLVGREAELAKLDALLAVKGCRVTLCGPPGVGKTTLASAAAERMRQPHPDGVWIVELAALDNAADVASAAASALSLPGQAGTSLEQFGRALAQRRMLLLLDNCEQVKRGVQALCDALLRSAPGVSVLATSRRDLDSAGERVLRLEPLSLPVDDTLSAARSSGAVTLFEERARRADARFQLTSTNAAAVCRIGRLLDGVPLAINFAAARVALWGVDVLSQRLLDPISTLGPAPAGQNPRHRTAADTIRWSYGLLGRHGQQLLTALGAFAGTVRLDGLVKLAAELGMTSAEVLEGCSDLLDNSLLSSDAGSLLGVDGTLTSAQPRYVMHALVRDFAHEQIQASASAARLHHAHALWCRDLIHDTLPGEKRRPNDVTPPSADVNNVRKAVRWASEADPVLAMELCGRMSPFWRARGMYREALEFMLPLLQAPVPDSALLVRARCRNRSCGLLHESERYQDMLDMTQAAFADAQSAESACEMAQAFGWRGLAQAALGLIEEAIHTLDEGLVHARRGDDQVLEGVILANIGLLRIAVNNLTQADADLSAAQALAARLGDHFIRAIAVSGRGRIDYLHDNKPAALLHFSEAVNIYRRLDMQYRVGNSLVSQAIVEVDLGDTQAAAAHLQEALRVGVRHSLERIIGESMLGLAGLHLACGDAGRARALMQSSERILPNPGSMYDILKPAHATWAKALRLDDLAPLPATAVHVATVQGWTTELVARLGPARGL